MAGKKCRVIFFAYLCPNLIIYACANKHTQLRLPPASFIFGFFSFQTNPNHLIGSSKKSFHSPNILYYNNIIIRKYPV
ncbi:hypothetical protein B4099_1023 [Heyndrickxia coagulans]|uniref:Uncharacterized protein n=1 Tax=Heyndrickxia coagulans TaxID=1398 RepID=A0A150K4I0_HEYCO|nr:hypothetical protein B4099_1023 [Heyndrickxia coagulans]